MAKEPKEKRPPIGLDPERLNKGAQRLLDQMGECRLCRQFITDERVPRGIAFWLEPKGKKAGADAADELIRKGRVRSLDDSLFPGDAQSFEVASMPASHPPAIGGAACAPRFPIRIAAGVSSPLARRDGRQSSPAARLALSAWVAARALSARVQRVFAVLKMIGGRSLHVSKIALEGLSCPTRSMSRSTSKLSRSTSQPEG